MALVSCLVAALTTSTHARADGDDDAAPRAVRARFTTSKAVDEVRTQACALTGAFLVAGRARTWNVSVDEQPCARQSASADALVLRISIKDETVTVDDHTLELRRTVMLEAPIGDSDEQTIQRAVTATGIALRDARTAPAVVHDTHTTPQNRGGGGGPSTAVAATAAVAGGVAAGVTVAIVVVVGVVVGGFIALFSAVFGAFSKH